MTLSQGIIKKWLLVFILCFSMCFAFFPQSTANAASTTFYETIPAGTGKYSFPCSTPYRYISQSVRVTNLTGAVKISYFQYYDGTWHLKAYSGHTLPDLLRYYDTNPTPYTLSKYSANGYKHRLYIKALNTSTVKVTCWGSPS
ncbi:hypothetical protein [Bacillus rhizoplanae]|uniref:hypothetical protein n=1 Tax=Bacillus rhizoplanae TaxID=2880966 RepID=UPI003D1D8951